MADGSSESLNFDTAALNNATVEVARKLDPLKDYILPLSALALFFLAIYLSLRISKKLLAKNSNPAFFKMEDLPPPLRVATVPLLLGYFLTHVFSAATVYYNTQIANPSTLLYFEAMGTGRLLSLTHAHLFAHATMYFILAALVQLTGTGFVFTVLAPLMALWAGVFDVFSWWGLKSISPNFEWLSIACGSIFSVAFVLMAFAILRSALRGKAAR
ncbi:MAG: hypothetical protein R3A80_11085 [Bdellovibrionota bacterium]